MLVVVAVKVLLLLLKILTLNSIYLVYAFFLIFLTPASKICYLEFETIIFIWTKYNIENIGKK